MYNTCRVCVDLEDGLLFFWKRIRGLGAGVVMMNMRSHGAVSVGFTSGTSEGGREDVDYRVAKFLENRHESLFQARILFI